MEVHMPGLKDLVSVPSGINQGLNGTGNAFMLSLLGNPRPNYTADCQPVTNAKLKGRFVSAVNVGPFKVTGFDLAVESLKTVMADIKVEQPNVHAALSTAGMLCCRLVRGSTSAISNHSWGTAVDLKIQGVLDPRGDNKVQFGLTLIAPIFNRHKWFWGAGFPTEDGMHFEISQQLLKKWHADGLLLPGHKPASTVKMMLGDRGENVVDLQKRLNKLGAKLEADGVFGQSTHRAVIAFQGQEGLSPDGIVGKATWKRLVDLTS
jgi:Putative peptidoglycan binding domain/D-alanyl-D-alanine carboxypeptidase